MIDVVVIFVALATVKLGNVMVFNVTDAPAESNRLYGVITYVYAVFAVNPVISVYEFVEPRDFVFANNVPFREINTYPNAPFL